MPFYKVSANNQQQQQIHINNVYIQTVYFIVPLTFTLNYHLPIQGLRSWMTHARRCVDNPARRTKNVSSRKFSQEITWYCVYANGAGGMTGTACSSLHLSLFFSRFDNRWPESNTDTWLSFRLKCVCVIRGGFCCAAAPCKWDEASRESDLYLCVVDQKGLKMFIHHVWLTYFWKIGAVSSEWIEIIAANKGICPLNVGKF